MKSRFLVYDIETSPLITYTWGIYEERAIEVIEDWQILCFAYKWLDEKKTHVVAQNDFKSYKKGENNDKDVVKALWDLFDEADAVIAHNGDRFDQKKTTARFMHYGMSPPSPYQSIDTKKVAKRYAGFSSNKLDDLGKTLGLGHKAETGGFGTWKGCMAGDKKAWDKMKRYNKRDVVLLEKLYLELRPWITNHPAINVLESRPNACPKCGGTKIYAGMKYRATNTNLYQYFRCMDCGGMIKRRIPEYKQALERMQYVS